MNRLRLFPLASTVLFPGMDLPLVVFEERYRQLVAECLAESVPFGVVLIKEGREVGGGAVTHPVGTTARLRSVQPAADGRLQVVARGERRFRIIEPYLDRPYLSARVEYPVDEISPLSDASVERARESYRQIERLRQTMEGLYTRDSRMPESPGALADAIAPTTAVVIGPERLQALLEMFDVRQRLDAASELLGDVVELTHRRAQMVVAQRWGGIERRN
ncbi:MAG: LON peptidase substrate-binding domain-containing protein [Dehalococcoidia bacterium]